MADLRNPESPEPMWFDQRTPVKAAAADNLADRDGGEEDDRTWMNSFDANEAPPSVPRMVSQQHDDSLEHTVPANQTIDAVQTPRTARTHREEPQHQRTPPAPVRLRADRSVTTCEIGIQTTLIDDKVPSLANRAVTDAMSATSSASANSSVIDSDSDDDVDVDAMLESPAVQLLIKVHMEEQEERHEQEIKKLQAVYARQLDDVEKTVASHSDLVHRMHRKETAALAGVLRSERMSLSIMTALQRRHAETAMLQRYFLHWWRHRDGLVGSPRQPHLHVAVPTLDLKAVSSNSEQLPQPANEVGGVLVSDATSRADSDATLSEEDSINELHEPVEEPLVGSSTPEQVLSDIPSAGEEEVSVPGDEAVSVAASAAENSSAEHKKAQVENAPECSVAIDEPIRSDPESTKVPEQQHAVVAIQPQPPTTASEPVDDSAPVSCPRCGIDPRIPLLPSLIGKLKATMSEMTATFLNGGVVTPALRGRTSRLRAVQHRHYLLTYEPPQTRSVGQNRNVQGEPVPSPSMMR